MKKLNFFFAAVAGFALAGCSSDEYVGTPTENLVSNKVAINFGSDAQATTRGEADANVVSKLKGQFIIYGVKQNASESNFADVFPSYRLWNKSPEGAQDISNTQGWEYVGNSGTSNLGAGNISLDNDQTIKYWDYNSDTYRFVAGSPVSAFTFNKDENGVITSAAVSGIGGHIKRNPGTTPLDGAVYVSAPIITPKASYGNPVTFTFTGQQALVRVGLYETIPGYSVEKILFYYYDINNEKWVKSETGNIILNSTTNENYFTGGTDLQATVTFDWDNLTATMSNPTGTTETSNQWHGGAFTGVPATNSSASTLAELYGTAVDMQQSGYFPVLPTPTGIDAAPVLIYCDFTLKAEDGSNETINVSGATAAIPAAFTQWKVNHSYTYIFKISDKSGASGEGLYPIVFDAVVQGELDNRNGFITTISTPAITSYQPGSPFTTVEDDVIKSTGIKYVPNEPIYVTVHNGELKELTAYNTPEAEGMIRVYKLTVPYDGAIDKNNPTESDLQINRPASGSAFTSEIPTSDWTLHNETITSGKYMTFTPDEAGYYAVEYINTASPASYAYKVIIVE